jgi:hypothetical protein
LLISWFALLVPSRADRGRAKPAHSDLFGATAGIPVRHVDGQLTPAHADYHRTKTRLCGIVGGSVRLIETGF